MQQVHVHQPLKNLSAQIQTRHGLNRLCAEAVNRQIESGNADGSHLRNRRRYLAKQLLKHIPHASRLSAKRLLHAAAMVLAMWGFGGMTMPSQVEAAPVFKHVTLDGFDAGAYPEPSFIDIDGDGDFDAFIGDVFGTVKFYRNIGSNTAASFIADTAGNPLAGVYVGRRSASPTFADIDNDGDLDAFVGSGYSVVKFYRNTGTRTAPAFSADRLGNPLAGINIGGGFYINASPAFADIDGDGDLDVFIGDNYGTVKFYRNNGTSSAANFAADPAGNPLLAMPIIFNDNVSPAFVDIDNDGDLDALIGDAKSGTVKFFRNNGTSNTPNFMRDTAANPLAIVSGSYSAKPAFVDIDNDGDLDAFVGSVNAVAFYPNTGNASTPGFTHNPAPLAQFKVSSNRAAPAFVDIDNDGDLDAIIGEGGFGAVQLSRNTGASTTPSFVSAPVYLFGGGSNGNPAFADIDNDGDLDAFVGSSRGVAFQKNIGTPATFNFVTNFIANPLPSTISALRDAAPAFADIDNDGDLDLFVGEISGTVKFYRNNGTASAAVFVAEPAGNPLAGVNVGSDAAPIFADIDKDGDSDVFVGEFNGTVKFYRNTGTATIPSFTAANGTSIINPLTGFDVGQVATPSFADIDNDGDLDVFVGSGAGRVNFFQNFDPNHGVPATVAVPHDFNGDGKSDILFHQASTGRNFMTLMNGRAVLSQGFVRKLAASWTVVGNGDYNGDGKADMLFHQASTGKNFMVLMNGRAVLSQGFVRKLAASWTVVGNGDYNGDGKADVLLHQASTGRNFIMLMNGRTVLSQGFVRKLAPSWTVVGNGDYNGDGKADMLFHQASTGKNFMVLMNGRAVISQGFVRKFATSWAVVGNGDYNGDGKADMLFHQASTGRNFMVLMNGRAVLSQGFVRDFAASWTIVGSGDYNGDGKADILFHQASTGKNFMVLMNGRAVLSQGFVRKLATSWSVVDTQ